MGLLGVRTSSSQPSFSGVLAQVDALALHHIFMLCYKLRSKNGLSVVFDSWGDQFCLHLHHRIAIVWSP
jgi:hypothetical protein